MAVWKYEDAFEDRFPPYQAFSRFWTRKLLKGLLHLERGGQRPEFHIPGRLLDAWGVDR
jgi:hypothetical protein